MATIMLVAALQRPVALLGEAGGKAPESAHFRATLEGSFVREPG
jgi:hypothetical protein